MFVSQITPEPPKKKRKTPWVLILIVPLGIFAATLASIVARHLTPQAQAVLAGAVCGAVAAIPVSAFLTYLLMKARQANTSADEKTAPAYPTYPGMGMPYQQPPIVLQMAPPAPQPSWTPGPADWSTHRTTRKFVEIGGSTHPQGDALEPDLDD